MGPTVGTGETPVYIYMYIHIYIFKNIDSFLNVIYMSHKEAVSARSVH